MVDLTDGFYRINSEAHHLGIYFPIVHLSAAAACAAAAAALAALTAAGACRR